MISRINRLFCNHKYIMRTKLSPYYISCGDESQERKSREYYMVCSKCGKKITIIKDWKTIEIDKDNYFE